MSLTYKTGGPHIQDKMASHKKTGGPHIQNKMASHTKRNRRASQTNQGDKNQKQSSLSKNCL